MLLLFFKMNECCSRRTPTQRNQTELAPASSKAYLKDRNSLHLLQVFPLAEKWGDSFQSWLHSLFRNSFYFHLNLSNLSFWSCFPWAAHLWQSLFCPGVDWLQGLTSFLHTSGESYSPIIWDNSRFACSLTVPAALLSVFQNSQSYSLTHMC